MEQSDSKKLTQILQDTCLHAYLATCDSDQPCVRPVSPIVEDENSIWIATSSSSRKVKQIKQNPKISLAFVELPQGEKAAFVIGECEIIPDLNEKRRIWRLTKYDPSQHWPGGPESEEYCLLKVKVNQIEWRDTFTAQLNIYEPKA